MTRIKIVGLRFDRLLVISEANPVVEPSGRLRRRVLVRCDCGKEKVVRPSKLRNGNTKSCGCLGREFSLKRFTTHGDGSARRYVSEYRIWAEMKYRCLVIKNKAYHNYGGRGIYVCDRWIYGDGVSGGYQCFLADMGRRPSAKHSIDREDNDGSYSPENCRWATKKQQLRNQRKNIFVTIAGVAMTLAEAVERSGIHYQTAYGRIQRGVSPERAIIPGGRV